MKTPFSLLSIPVLVLLASPAVAEEKEAWDVSDADLGPTKTLRWTVDEGTWMDLDVSPDGQWIVFDLLGDIYKLPISGGKATALRTGPAYEVQPRFSPDGSEIAFTSDAGGGDNIWIMDTDGAEARQLTKESFRLLNNPAWSPDGKTLVARKHFTSRRSLGAGEMWMYDVSTGGSGVQLTEKPNEQKDVNEPEFSPDGKYLYYTLDSTPGSRFQYNKDPNSTIYTMRRIDLTTGKEITIADQPGGSLRPEASPDGKHLAFVRRVRTKTVLMVQDLETGLQRPVYDGLSQDSQETWSIFGTYPGFAWTPDSKSVVIWAKGKLHRIDIDSGQATLIPFEADLRAEVVDALRFKQKFGQETFDVHVARWAAPSPNGDQIVFQALGYLWIRDREGGTPRRLTNDTHFEYYPSWSPDGSQIIYSTWNDQTGGRINAIALRGGTKRTLVDEPGHYAYPSLSKDGAWLLYQRVGGDGYRGHAFTNNRGTYLKPMGGGEARKVTSDGGRPQFDSDENRILLFEWTPKKKALFSIDFLGGNRRDIATSERAQEMALSPSGEWIAFRELWEVYAAPRPRTGKPISLSPKMKSLPVKKISNVAGEYLSWSPDGKTLNYSLGSDLFCADIPGIFHGESKPDSIALGWKAKTDIPETNVVLRGAKVLTMEMDSQGVIENGAVHVVGNRIVAVGKSEDIQPADARDIDVRGKVLMPGFVDTHAHTGSSNNGLQAQQTWAFVANLAFGVTTTHDPSNNTTMIFASSEMAKAGHILAPRVFSTGTILYGAEGDFKAPTESYEDALRHLTRLKAYGAFSAKSYNQPRRNQRQYYVKAGRELEMMIVPEGGSFYTHNMTMFLDGHTTLEHTLPVAELYEDAMYMMSQSNTAYTPTLVVGYGGLWGENYWYQKHNIWENERLMRFTPRNVVDPRARRRPMVPDDEFHHFKIANHAARMVQRGGLATVGAHGQLQGLGTHWELWMFGQGGLEPLDALKVATIHGAIALGLDDEIGTIEAGKLADLIVMDEDPLADLSNTTSISLVMMNGRLFDANSMNQLEPEAKPLPAGPPLDTVPLNAVGAHCLFN